MENTDCAKSQVLQIFNSGILISDVGMCKGPS